MQASGPPISGRERDVLVALGEHLTNAEIAQRLHISVRTVESHVSSLLRKLGAGDRRELARLADGHTQGPGDEAGQLRGAPAAVTSFVGRSRELEAVSDALATARLVNLVGPGGAGKTRVAVEAAARVPGGAWFVDLVPVRAAAVAGAVAAALEVVERPNLSIEDALEQHLRRHGGLVVLDNCEHVLGAVAALLERLLPACPDLHVLATSRELLGVDGERAVPIAELVDSDAVDLFVERARALDPAFEAGSDDAALVEVCRRLDGIPLAIELAAARCAVLGLDGVRDGLNDRLRLLAGARRGDRRHRSLRDVLDWSHDLLDPAEQVVLRRASAFASDFRVADAVVVAGAGLDDGAVAEALGQLTAKSLVVRRSERGATAYRLLETVREYAAERLAASGEREAVLDAHLAWAAAATRAAEAALADDAPWQFGPLAAEARAALAWIEERQEPSALGHQLARSFAHLAYARRSLSESHAVYRTASALAPDAATAAADLRLAAGVAYARMRADLAYDDLLRAAVLAERHDPASAAIALADASSFAARCPAEFAEVVDLDVLRAHVERARALVPDPSAEVAAHLAVADAWVASKECWADLDLARRAVAAVRELDDPPLLSVALDAETAGMWEDSRFLDAHRLARQRFALVERLDRSDPRTGGEIIDIFHMVADTALAAGDLHGALDAAAMMAKDEMGQTALHAATRSAVIALVLLGRFEEAVTEAEVMRREWELAGRPSAAWMMSAAMATALAHGLRGDRAAVEEWVQVAEATGGSPGRRPRNHGFVNYARARLALHDGRLDEARAAVEDFDPTRPGIHLAFSAAAAAEAAVACGDDAAAETVAGARTAVEYHPWASAVVLRAEAHLHGDGALLQAAADAFLEVGARFEWAVTALELGGAAAEEAQQVLASLRATPPAHART